MLQPLSCSLDQLLVQAAHVLHHLSESLHTLAVAQWGDTGSRSILWRLLYTLAVAQSCDRCPRLWQWQSPYTLAVALYFGLMVLVANLAIDGGTWSSCRRSQQGRCKVHRWPRGCHKSVWSKAWRVKHPAPSSLFLVLLDGPLPQREPAAGLSSSQSHV